MAALEVLCLALRGTPLETLRCDQSLREHTLGPGAQNNEISKSIRSPPWKRQYGSNIVSGDGLGKGSE
eukprot:COSAG02_NODE_25230_length_665_cov_0.879859_2_plen_67_part_01